MEVMTSRGQTQNRSMCPEFVSGDMPRNNVRICGVYDKQCSNWRILNDEMVFRILYLIFSMFSGCQCV